MPTAFLRSPADSLGYITARDKLRRRNRGGLLQEDGDQDFGLAEGRTGPQRTGPNMQQNRDITMGTGSREVQPMNSRAGARTIRPQDTRTGGVGRVAQFQGKTGSVGQEPNARDTVGGRVVSPLDKSGQEESRDVGGSVAPQGEKPLTPMSEGEVQSAVHKMVWDAIEYIDQELSPFRALASKFYQAEPFGNEEQGRSQVVMTDLRDTVLMIMPSLMRIFFGADGAVEYGPIRPETVKMAEDVTKFVNQVVIKTDNRGFLVFYEWFKDALVKRLGIAKYWYDDSIETRSYSTSYLSEDALTLLTRDPDLRVDSVSPTPGSPPGASLYDVEYTRTKQEGRVRFIALPPEEYLFTRGARTTTDDHSQPGVALFVGHRTELTRSQLLEIGVSEADIEEWAFKDVSLEHNQEEIARQHIVKPDTSAIGPIATQKALYIEGYPYMDVDGDGVSELRKITMLGPSYHVIENVSAARRPFAVICPDPEPHTIIGQGVSDYTMDLQRINSMIVRSTLDSLALSLNPRIGYIDGDANLEDILNPEIGAPIRMRSPQAITPIEHNFVGKEALPVLQYFEGVKENRTGITRASAGLDPDALQSTTKAAVTATVSAAQQHIEMIARVFAETGVAQLYRGILELLVENQAPSRMVRVAGEYVQMDPRSWDANLDVIVKVAIGAGLDDQKYAVFAELAQRMEQAFAGMGLQQPIFSPKNYRDVVVKMLKLRGQMDAETYVQNVPANWQPPPQPSQDPNMVIAQAEQKKAEAHVAKQQADMALDQQKHQHEVQKHGAEIQLKQQQQAQDAQLKREQMLLDDQRQREQMKLELEMKEREIALEHQRAVSEAQIEADLKRAKDQADAETKQRAQEAEAKARQTEAENAVKSPNGDKDKKSTSGDSGTKTVRVVIAHEKDQK